MAQPLIQCGRDGNSYTIHIDGELKGKYATPEIMQVHFAGLLAEKQRDQERLDFLATCNEGWCVVEELNDRRLTFWDADGTPFSPARMRKQFRRLIDEAINDANSFGQDR